jgi:hypothetical protein
VKGRYFAVGSKEYVKGTDASGWQKFWKQTIGQKRGKRWRRV